MKLMSAGLLCVMLALVPMLAEASVFWIEDFEVPSGGLDAPNSVPTTQAGVALQGKGWNDFRCGSVPCTSKITNMIGHTGSFTNVLEQDYVFGMTQYPNGIGGPGSGTGPGASLIGRDISPPTDEFYEVYWLRYEILDPTAPYWAWADGFYSVGSKQHYFNPGGADSTFGISYFFYKGNANSLGLEIGGNPTSEFCVVTQRQDVNCDIQQNINLTPFPLNQWVCVETHYKMNTPGVGNGIVELWMDGALHLQYTNTWMRDSINVLWRHMQIYRQDAVNLKRFEDDYTLSTTRVGCSGGPIDVTPPAVPTGLGIR